MRFIPGCCCDCGDPLAYYREHGFLPGQSQFVDFTTTGTSAGGVRAQPNNLWLNASFPTPPDLIYGNVNGHGRAHPVNPPHDTIYCIGSWYGNRTVFLSDPCAYAVGKINHHELEVFHPRYLTQYASTVALYCHFRRPIDLDDLIEPSPFPPLPAPFNNPSVNGFKVTIHPFGTQDHQPIHQISLGRVFPSGFNAGPNGMPTEDAFWGSVNVDMVDGAELMWMLTHYEKAFGLFELRILYNDEIIFTEYLAKDPELWTEEDYPVEDYPELEDKTIHEMNPFGEQDISSGAFASGFVGFHNPSTMEVDEYRLWVGTL